MKKLFVLFLCLMAAAGFVSAGTVHPPGEMSPEMALSGYGVNDAAVTPDTVLATATLTHELPGQILTVSGIMITELPRIVFTITVIDTGRAVPDDSMDAVDYPLRL
jgi:hypothetical protein